MVWAAPQEADHRILVLARVVFASEKDVVMSDQPDAGKQPGLSVPVVVVEKGVDQDLTREQGSGNQIPSFKEKLIGQSDMVRGSHSIAELDVEVTNRRRRNVNLHGAVGRNSGVTKNKEVLGSRFQLLASDSMDENEEVTELQPLGDVSGWRDVSREGSLANTEHGQGTNDNDGSVEMLRWGRPMNTELSVGAVNRVGSVSANQNSSREGAEARVETDRFP
ncbi:hypothetical protein V6N11_037883 [Hibiscus sabdariffa]|uniref:Uncharacterized protein n=2 Tax=Hibiscus sabdariffa TaxID=183260 RepID=A0ABR1ZIY6_9ROSI